MLLVVNVRKDRVSVRFVDLQNLQVEQKPIEVVSSTFRALAKYYELIQSEGSWILLAYRGVSSKEFLRCQLREGDNVFKNGCGDHFWLEDYEFLRDMLKAIDLPAALISEDCEQFNILKSAGQVSPQGTLKIVSKENGRIDKIELPSCATRQDLAEALSPFRGGELNMEFFEIMLSDDSDENLERAIRWLRSPQTLNKGRLFLHYSQYALSPEAAALDGNITKVCMLFSRHHHYFAPQIIENERKCGYSLYKICQKFGYRRVIPLMFGENSNARPWNASMIPQIDFFESLDDAEKAARFLVKRGVKAIHLRNEILFCFGLLLDGTGVERFLSLNDLARDFKSLAASILFKRHPGLSDLLLAHLGSDSKYRGIDHYPEFPDIELKDEIVFGKSSEGSLTPLFPRSEVVQISLRELQECVVKVIPNVNRFRAIRILDVPEYGRAHFVNEEFLIFNQAAGRSEKYLIQGSFIGDVGWTWAMVELSVSLGRDGVVNLICSECEGPFLMFEDGSVAWTPLSMVL